MCVCIHIYTYAPNYLSLIAKIFAGLQIGSVIDSQTISKISVDVSVETELTPLSLNNVILHHLVLLKTALSLIDIYWSKAKDK